MYLKKVKGANKSPLLLAQTEETMIDKGKIEKIIEDYFKDTDKFLVDLNVSSTNQIAVFVDSDTFVNVADCISLSRHIESFFDREVEDFELEVSSTGISKSLLTLRQYHKNIGKPINVMNNEGVKIKGDLTEVKAEGITLDITPFLSKKEKKEKKDTLVYIPFANIKEAKIIFSFN
jgi:ribosome maturation factor RimP